LNIISLGAGVQSSCMSLMFAEGELAPMPDFAIFADTHDEPRVVYDWLDWLEGQLPFPVVRVTAGSLSKAATTQRKSKKTGNIYLTPNLPIYYKKRDSDQHTLGRRHCTRQFKIDPINKWLRKLRKENGSPHIMKYIGISYDEVLRMKPAQEPWATHSWPLVDLRMTRGHCFEWMDAHGYPAPPRSACVYCPFKSNGEWSEMKANAPEDFHKAVTFERELQQAHIGATAHGGIVPFLHKSLVPISDADFPTASSMGQIDAFQNECEGMCGV